MAPAPRYDRIGLGYADQRRPDRRIGAQIWSAVGGASRILNVGAGTGSYEDTRRSMVAVEPSAVMISQSSTDAGPAVRAVAEQLPFPDQSFDVALALMTVHHWHDLRQGLSEMRRVARRQVVFTFEPVLHDSLWIFQDYVPAIIGMTDHATVSAVADALKADRVETVPVPHDCTDGFITAYWRRPERYLEPAVRASTSGFARLGDELVDPGLQRLAADLASGEWARRYADLLELDALDTGLRLVIAG